MNIENRFLAQDRTYTVQETSTCVIHIVKITLFVQLSV